MILDQLLVVMIPRIAAGPHLDLETRIKIKSENQKEQVDVLHSSSLPFDVIMYQFGQL